MAFIKPTPPPVLKNTFYEYEINSTDWTGIHSSSLPPVPHCMCGFSYGVNIHRHKMNSGSTDIVLTLEQTYKTMPFCDPVRTYCLNAVVAITTFVKEHNEHGRQINNQVKTACYDSTPLVADICGLIVQYCDEQVSFVFIDQVTCLFEK